MGNINYGSRGVGVVGRSDYVGRTKWGRAFYDFATDGGAVGAINLRGDKLPSGARIISSYIDVTTQVTSGGAATVSLGTEAATDIRAAATLSTAPKLDTVATPLGAVTPATAGTKLAANQQIVAVLGGACSSAATAAATFLWKQGIVNVWTGWTAPLQRWNGWQ